MFEVFKYVEKFFTSLTNYITFNDIFIIFAGLFLLAIIFVFISTSHAYEVKLIKAVDKFNAYFINNPQINEENLVAFNAKMKAKYVPKQLRKSWQQFVLYREQKASDYMSFENCVSNPIKNSSYTRDTKTLNIIAHICSICALILNCYYCYETLDFANILRQVLLTPVVILLVNFCFQIFFKIRHSAIISDLFQNYQYFEVNIDRATTTLPEYVDYEVLFDRNEIKKGIPILYTYLQKRAEEEQRELERARLKNVEHEKFNFDDTGVEASLVLERAMQEAENYIAERKKYNQDTQQINNDMTQEDLNYREITKEYNRQMQVSKETFENFKAQLEDASSSIEANYLKKQQQQELDRQRNLERDFDMATERHKKVIEGYHAELDAVDKFIGESRKNLEDAMKSEFSSYSSKVYDEAKKVAEERQKEKMLKLKEEISALEEKLILKENELNNVYNQNQILNEQLEGVRGSTETVVNNEAPAYQSEETYTPNEQPTEVYEEYNAPEEAYEEYVEPEAEVNDDYNQPTAEVYDDYDQPMAVVYDEFRNQHNEDNVEYDEEYSDQENIPEMEETWEEVETDLYNIENQIGEENNSTISNDDGMQMNYVSDGGRSNVVADTNSNQGGKKRGRPRKVVTDEKPIAKRGPGRPKKVVQPTTEGQAVKRGPGRPKKVAQPAVQGETKLKKRGPGRPKKVASKTEGQTNVVKRGPGRPKKAIEAPAKTEVKKRGRPRKEQDKPVAEVKRGRGRPRKNDKQVPESIKDIDEYLKKIAKEIAQENAKMEETQKELVKNARIKRKK